MPDLSAMLEAAQRDRRPVPLDMARQALGDLFDEDGLAMETLVFRGADVSLTPTTWVRLVRRAKARLEDRRSES